MILSKNQKELRRLQEDRRKLPSTIHEKAFLVAWRDDLTDWSEVKWSLFGV